MSELRTIIDNTAKGALTSEPVVPADAGTPPVSRAGSWLKTSFLGMDPLVPRGIGRGSNSR